MKKFSILAIGLFVLLNPLTRLQAEIKQVSLGLAEKQANGKIVQTSALTLVTGIGRIRSWFERSLYLQLAFGQVQEKFGFQTEVLRFTFDQPFGQIYSRTPRKLLSLLFFNISEEEPVRFLADLSHSLPTGLDSVFSRTRGNYPMKLKGLYVQVGNRGPVRFQRLVSLYRNPVGRMLDWWKNVTPKERLVRLLDEWDSNKETPGPANWIKRNCAYVLERLV